ncbi:unnamed protein product [Brachionus calyciflorus]|uniref:ISXO2-like transposase domain-containing protein n=1 Tax=Brachionus calyciflorus TaxID=104777 RepID=A0A814H359_9BILA|nr:unnamed protein product [Brachionus calyciflorus]
MESNDKLKIIKWLQHKKIIPVELVCKCSNNFKLQERKDIVDGYNWRCTKCSTRRSIRTGTFMADFNISLNVILKLILYWSIQTRQLDQSDFIQISRQTIITFQQKVRLVIVKNFNPSGFTLGGPGTIVEIDESLFIKVKHNKGKDLFRPQIWVFGMYERNSKKCLFMVVKKRDAFTLLNAIYTHILPGTLIYSDCWSAYSRIRDLDKAFEHRTVNHSLFFVNAEDGTHSLFGVQQRLT